MAKFGNNHWGTISNFGLLGEKFLAKIVKNEYICVFFCKNKIVNKLVNSHLRKSRNVSPSLHFGFR